MVMVSIIIYMKEKWRAKERKLRENITEFRGLRPLKIISYGRKLSLKQSSWVLNIP